MDMNYSKLSISELEGDIKRLNNEATCHFDLTLKQSNKSKSKNKRSGAKKFYKIDKYSYLHSNKKSKSKSPN